MTVEALQFITDCLNTVSVTGIQNSQNLLNSVGMINSIAVKMKQSGIKDLNELFDLLEPVEKEGDPDDLDREGEE